MHVDLRERGRHGRRDVLLRAEKRIATAPLSETARPPKGLTPHEDMSLALASQQRWLRLHEERRPQELAVSERRHSEHHDVHLRHDAQIIGDLHRHGLQLLANVQRELRADQLVLPVACSEYTPPLQGLDCKEGDRVGDKAGDERETATCVLAWTAASCQCPT